LDRDDTSVGSPLDHPFAWADVDLPLLQRGAMMGRLAAKVSTGVFFIINLFFSER
jgi:hypothetical protein